MNVGVHLESQSDATDDFSVGFKLAKGNPTLGLRLAQLPGGRGAAFDGWKDDKESTGENHELLEVGDRLISVNDVLVAPGTSTFTRIRRLVHEAIETLVRQTEEAESKALEEKASGLAPVRSKYSVDAGRSANLRVHLNFRKPARDQTVVLESGFFEADTPADVELGAWFRPADDTMCGAVFEGLVQTSPSAVQKAFSNLSMGARLLAVSNRSVEGLKFDVVLDCIREAKFPIVLRLGNAANVSSQEETRALARTLDPHFRIMNKPFGTVHLEQFFSRLAEADRDYVTARLQDGLRMGVRDNVGRTPLMCAAVLSNEDDSYYFINLLLKEGADIDEVDTSNASSVLHFAARIGHVSVLETLLQAGANPNLTDRQGKTPLLEAVINNRVRAVSVLLHGGANGELVERSAGWNCLHYAALNGRDDIIELLLSEQGKLSPHTKTLPGPWRTPRTAIDIAREANHGSAARLLHERLASEALQRVYPRPGDWVVMDDTLAVPDLPWRKGSEFKSLREVELTRRQRSCNKLENFRMSRPAGLQDPREMLRQENAISAFVEDLDDAAEIWLGSRESLLQKKLRKNKQINAVIVVVTKDHEQRQQQLDKTSPRLQEESLENKNETFLHDGNLFQDPRLKWIAETKDHYILDQGVDDFEAFTKHHLGVSYKVKLRLI